MKWTFLVLMFALTASVGKAQGTDDVQTVRGFRVPTYDDDGNMTSQMFGDFAKILPDGLVEIEALRMEFYSGPATNRHTDMQVISPRCYYQRDRGTANSDQSVRISRNNMVVSGTGFSWSSSNQLMKIYNDAKVVLMDVTRQMKEGEGGKP